MQSITVDIVNENALKLLQDLELLQLIRIHIPDVEHAKATNWTAKYKGAMTKAPLAEIDHQLHELRDAWQ